MGSTGGRLVGTLLMAEVITAMVLVVSGGSLSVYTVAIIGRLRDPLRKGAELVQFKDSKMTLVCRY